MNVIDHLPRAELYDALMARDSSYEGVFYTAVKTTGIFCRPTCPARTPLPKNVEFFGNVSDALSAGYRPCKRCRPMEPKGGAPRWLSPLLAAVEHDPTRRWRDADLAAMDLDPGRVRRWFRTHHGMTFHAYQRARRLGHALGQLSNGDRITYVAYENGFESVSGFREAFGRLYGRPPGRGRETVPMFVTRILTPLGPMVAGATEDGVCLLEFADRRGLEAQIRRLRSRLDLVPVPGGGAHIDQLEAELAEYFAGTRRVFTVPLVVPGTDFQLDVWGRLQNLPYGATTTYEAIARAIGRPTAVRAVGRANGDNRLAIIIPCHRVIGADGRLRGYGGGLRRKEALLAHEGASLKA